ncbi:MAG TPA: hypothetical protein VFM55_00535 [Micromonosporaceae bacterium]|nr:hypothetical protein [Micromonosporaceae bacterium]
MPTLVTHPRDLLTFEQQEMYDGVLAESANGRQTAAAVLARYAGLVQEQARDVAAVRSALLSAKTEAAGSSCTDQTETHPIWCTRSHAPDAAHSSPTVTIEQGHSSLTHTDLYLWQPPDNPAMLAAELRSDDDTDPLLFLLALTHARQLGQAMQQLVTTASMRAAARPDIVGSNGCWLWRAWRRRWSPGTTR